jgi:hypothetical protein
LLEETPELRNVLVLSCDPGYITTAADYMAKNILSCFFYSDECLLDEDESDSCESAEDESEQDGQDITAEPEVPDIEGG